jgi:hypothetical protein
MFDIRHQLHLRAVRNTQMKASYEYEPISQALFSSIFLIGSIPSTALYNFWISAS